MQITGTFIDEISHDIPHQNWGPKEWDTDFVPMKKMGIDTVILIRSGYRRFLTYPSPYLMDKHGCFKPPIDLVDLFLDLSGKHGIIFYFGTYDSGKYWNTLEDFLSINKALANKHGLRMWRNSESFDRDMPIKFLPIKFEKLRLKLEAAHRAGCEKAITFEFSHFMSPQSAYLQARHLYDRYREHYNFGS